MYKTAFELITDNALALSIGEVQFNTQIADLPSNFNVQYYQEDDSLWLIDNSEHPQPLPQTELVYLPNGSPIFEISISVEFIGARPHKPK